MRLRAPNTSERVIIGVFLKILQEARTNPANHDSRNMIYARVAERCGVTYDRVIDLCHNRIYVETSPGIHEHGWKREVI